MILSKPTSRLWLSLVLCSSPFIAAWPLEAATFSLGRSTLLLENFSQAPLSRDSTLTTDATSITGTDNDIAITDFDGTLDFLGEGRSVTLDGEFQSTAQGTGTQYFGFAEIVSEALATFNVAANSSFSFDFMTSLGLANITDGTPADSASSLARISLRLLAEGETPISFFDLRAGINTNSVQPGNDDFLSVNTNVLIAGSSQQASLGLPQEFAIASYTGAFQQVFSEPTQLTLVAQTSTQACVQAPGTPNACIQKVPEPNLVLGLAVGGIWAVFRRQLYTSKSGQ